MSVNRNVLHVAGSVGKSLYTSRCWSLLFGLETGVQLLQQQTTRKNEVRLRSIGYTPVPIEKTVVPFLGGLATVTPFVAGRIPLHCTIGVHDYVAKTSSGYSQFFRFNAGVTTGIIMSGHLKQPESTD